MAACQVEEGAVVLRGAGLIYRLVAAQSLDRPAERLPLLDAVVEPGRLRRGVDRLHPATLPGLAIDAVAPDQFEHRIATLPQCPAKPGPALLAELLLDVPRVEAGEEVRDRKAGVPPRGGETDRKSTRLKSMY